ncbi:MAG: hydrogenobyrinic acid a,c-diamide synthase (glutamine-hydrolyzing) [Gammaproteobacteria bacterium]|nr:hydrogenobyrinic acid a,c-diamide synthase (glutamine-hydrolyzing) [Gammaproteobacteria bacterium]
MAHIFIAGAHKSSGKTSVSVGLTAALTGRGMALQPFKKGPDYIDPLWLGRAAGNACYNLDFFTQSHDEIAATFAGHATTAGISLIEGNKGLFDGVDVAGSDSNAALAKMLAAPVVLVIDSSGMTRGIAPLIRGYLGFDPDVNIAGVILNKTGGTRHEGKLRAALERYTDIDVLGAIGRDSSLEIPERHLGLVPANETNATDTIIAKLAKAVTSQVELDRIVEIANAAPATATAPVRDSLPAADVRIGIARDAAFGFYYPDDLDAFALAGAELVPFDTLSDAHLPAVDGLFIGGGFPETHLVKLAENRTLLANIRQVLSAGMPAYAECGGLMYLARSIQWHNGEYAMAGVVPGDVIVDDRPQGRGYVLLERSGSDPWPVATTKERARNQRIPAHEFHYARLENLPDNREFAYRVQRGHGIDGRHDGLLVENLLAGFAHHRNTAANPWVERFVAFVRTKSQHTSSGEST